MREPNPPAPANGPPAPVPPPARKSSWKYTLALVAVLVAGATAYYLHEKSQNPTPDLQAKVKAAFEFDPATPLGKRFTTQGKTGFAPVSYEKDWEFVRKIDETLSHLLDAK